MLVDYMREYWTIVQYYTAETPQRRAAVLDGFIKIKSETHTNPKVRQRLLTFILRERLNHERNASNVV